MGRISHPGMPFSGMMMLPTELTLRTTKDGVRLFNNPVRETEKLFTLLSKYSLLTSDEANNKHKEYSDTDVLRIKTTFKLSPATCHQCRYQALRPRHYREIRREGVKVITLLSLSDSGKPDYDVNLPKEISKPGLYGLQL